MGYCRIHGSYDGDGCSDCQEALEAAASDRQEMLEQLEELRGSQEELAYAINNPGDYACPHCCLRSLKLLAKRCPKCHGTIDHDYWEPILQAEEDARRARKVEEEKRKIREAEEARSRTAREQAAARRKPFRQLAYFVIVLYWGYLWPVLTLTHCGALMDEKMRELTFTPVLNFFGFAAFLLFTVLPTDFSPPVGEFWSGLFWFGMIGVLLTVIGRLVTRD